MLISFFVIITYFALYIFSYFWVDMNLTLTTWTPINNLISKLQHLGYFNRDLSSRLYLMILISVFGIQLYLLFSDFLKKISLKHLLILAGLITFMAAFSYPFLSHDVFSYLFDAKIIWHYHQSPYSKVPEEFPNDPWLRFTHWTEYANPYGVVWLFYSLLPFIFSFSKFVLSFYGLKLLNGLLFFGAGLLLLAINKKDRHVFAYWFFNPFLLIELLINAHNDLLMISLFFLSIFLLKKKKKIAGWFSFLGSILTKYVSLVIFPAFLLKKEKRIIFFNLVIIFLLFYFGVQFKKIHPWYLTWLFLVCPFARLNKQSWFLFFCLPIIFSGSIYYPFILSGVWMGVSFDWLLRLLFILSALVFSLLQLKQWRKRHFRNII